MIAHLQSNFYHFLPIFFIGGLAIIITLERWMTLFWVYRVVGLPSVIRRVTELTVSGNVNEAILNLDKYKTTPTGRIMHETLTRLGGSDEAIRLTVESELSQGLERINQRISYLSMSANLATLMGLFGTVVGLVQSFQAVSEASVQQRAALVAAGISTAMYATLAGLAVAIPSVFLYTWLNSKAQRLSSELEQTASLTLRMIEEYYLQSTKLNGKIKSAS